MVKAIFFDIDGTLVSFETHKIPASTHEALKADDYAAGVDDAMDEDYEEW